jgi:hypothetical protein
MNHDCPYCCVSLKWKYVPSSEFLLFSTSLICPSCGERIELNVQNENVKVWEKFRDWRWWVIILFITIHPIFTTIYQSNKQKIYLYVSTVTTLVFIIFVIVDFYTNRDKYRDKNRNKPKYRKRSTPYKPLS